MTDVTDETHQVGHLLFRARCTENVQRGKTQFEPFTGWQVATSAPKVFFFNPFLLFAGKLRSAQEGFFGNLSSAQRIVWQMSLLPTGLRRQNPKQNPGNTSDMTCVKEVFGKCHLCPKGFADKTLGRTSAKPGTSLLPKKCLEHFASAQEVFASKNPSGTHAHLVTCAQPGWLQARIAEHVVRATRRDGLNRLAHVRGQRPAHDDAKRREQEPVDQPKLLHRNGFLAGW